MGLTTYDLITEQEKHSQIPAMSSSELQASPTPSHHLFWTVLCWASYHIPSQVKEQEYSQCHGTQTLPYTHSRTGRGIPDLFSARHWLSLRSVPEEFVSLRLIGLYLTQLFGECRGPPRVACDATRAREHREGAWRRISAVEFLSSDSVLFLEHNRLVFGWSSLSEFVCLNFCTFQPPWTSVFSFIFGTLFVPTLEMFISFRRFFLSDPPRKHKTHLICSCNPLLTFSQVLPT